MERRIFSRRQQKIKQKKFTNWIRDRWWNISVLLRIKEREIVTGITFRDKLTNWKNKQRIQDHAGIRHLSMMKSLFVYTRRALKAKPRKIMKLDNTSVHHKRNFIKSSRAKPLSVQCMCFHPATEVIRVVFHSGTRKDN